MNYTTLIVPAAGLSIRYNNTQKHMLLLPSGRVMFQDSISHLDLSDVSKIILTVVKDAIIDKKYLDKRLHQLATDLDKQIELCTLDKQTGSQVETVIETINKLNIKDSISIKDCDNIFTAAPKSENAVFVCQISNNINDGNKSWILEKKKTIIDIVEKPKVPISNHFCCGMYSFASAELFKWKYDTDIDKPEYISQIIKRLIDSQNTKFVSHIVSNYIDLGTAEDWKRYIGIK